MNNASLISFYVLAFVAEIIGTIGGFGSSLFFVPLANFYFDFHSVLGITALFHLFSNASKISLFKDGLDKNLIMWIGIPSVLFVIIGAIISKYLDDQNAELYIGLFLSFFSILILSFPSIKLKANKNNSIAGGAASGLLAGLLGTGGAVRGLTMAAFNLEKNVFLASSAVIDMAVDSSRFIVYLVQGYIKWEYLYYIPFLIIIAYIGTLLGKRILNKLSQDYFRKASLILILITGIVSLFQASFKE
jgi:uncharacterized membrane protein YfcA